MIAFIKSAWDKVSGVYEWVSDIVADYPKVALAAILILAVASVF